MAPLVLAGHKPSSWLVLSTQKSSKSWIFLRAMIDAVGTAIRAHNGYIFIADLKAKVEMMEAGTYPTLARTISEKKK
ncbi:hypothetical protein IT397_03470 [Candidatus Nomurabacteria bacterium]|nr:hypothetical protein [Candidatus Nomurabacteria bacterium]